MAIGQALEKLLRKLFDKVDVDKSGFIEMHEMKAICKAIAKLDKKEFDEKAYTEMERKVMASSDTNRDKKISFDEVLAGFGQSLENVDGILEYAQRLINEGYDHSEEAKSESKAAKPADSSNAGAGSNPGPKAAAAASYSKAADDDMGFSLFD